MKILITIFLLWYSQLALSIEVINPQRAKFNYQMFCQGCHDGAGIGYKSVPTLKGFVGNFLATKEGREYLIRVPGSANSALNSEELAELLNWIVLNFGEDSIPEQWTYYDEAEVDLFRQDPLFEVLEYRKQLVETMTSGVNTNE